MQFVCRVGTPDGRVREEVIVASDEVALRSELGKLGLHLFEVRRKGLPKGLTATGVAPRRKRIATQEFLIFNQELAALLKAGLPLLQALDLLLERMGNLRFKAVLGDIRDRVKSGADLSEAFAGHAELFPRLYPSTLKAGERSGELEAVIRRFVRYLRLLLDARRRVVSALVYPTVLVCVSIAMVAVMALYVVPKFMGIFQEVGAKLPLITRLVLSSSSFVINNWIALVAAGTNLQQRKLGRQCLGQLLHARPRLGIDDPRPRLLGDQIGDLCAGVLARADDIADIGPVEPRDD